MTRGRTASLSSWAVAGVALAFYAATASRRLGLPDTAIVLDAMREATLSSQVCNHNLNNLLGHLALALPGLNDAWKGALLAAVYGAAALGLFHAVLRAVGVPAVAAAGGSLVFMVSHSMWWHSTQAENYALSLVFLNASLLLAARLAAAPAPDPRRLAALFFLAGLALFNHVQNGLLLVAGAVYLLADARYRSARPRHAAVAAAAFAVGALPYGLMLTRDIAASGDLRGTLAAAAGGGFGSLMFRYSAVSLVRFGEWVLLQFPSPFLLLLPVGAMVLGCRRALRPFAVYLLAAFGVNTAFFLGYATWDQFSFYLPSFTCLALAGVVGAGELWSRPGTAARAGVLVVLWVSMLLPLAIYPRIRIWAANPDGYWGRRYHAAAEAYQGRYDLVGLYTDPWRRDRGTVEAYIDALFAHMPEGSMLIDDVSVYYQAEYVRRHGGRRPDLDLRLIRPLGMTGWGTPAARLAQEAGSATNRVFLTATNGPAQAVVRELEARGRILVPFPLGGRGHAFEVRPPPLAPDR